MYNVEPHMLDTDTDFALLQQTTELPEGRTGNPGDVWHINLRPSKSAHLAPFPPELLLRAVTLACPAEVRPIWAKRLHAQPGGRFGEGRNEAGGVS